MLSIQTLKILQVPLQFGTLFAILPFKWNNKSKRYTLLPKRVVKFRKHKFDCYPWKILLIIIIFGQLLLGLYYILFLFIFSQDFIDIMLILFALSIIGFSIATELIFLYKTDDVLHCCNSTIQINNKLGYNTKPIEVDGIEKLLLFNCILPIGVQIFVYPSIVILCYEEFNILKHFLFLLHWIPNYRELIALTITIVTTIDWIYVTVACIQAIAALHLINSWMNYQISNISNSILTLKHKRNIRIGYRTLQIFHKLLVDMVYYVLPLVVFFGCGLLISILYSIIRFRNRVGGFLYMVFGLVGMVVCLVYFTTILFAVKMNILSTTLPHAYLTRHPKV